MVKRIVVGFCVLAAYVSPIYIHPLALAYVSFHFSQMISYEAFYVHRKDFESIEHNLYRVALMATLCLFIYPKFGILERGIMERSGYTQEEYPMVFTILY